MKKNVKSDLRVKNWQEPINWYEPYKERCKYLGIPGIPQRIWVTEGFYETFKRVSFKNCFRNCGEYKSVVMIEKKVLRCFFKYRNKNNCEEIEIISKLCMYQRGKKHLNYKKNRELIFKKIIRFISTIIVIIDFFDYLIKLIQYFINYFI